MWRILVFCLLYCSLESMERIYATLQKGEELQKIKIIVITVLKSSIITAQENWVDQGNLSINQTVWTHIVDCQKRLAKNNAPFENFLLWKVAAVMWPPVRISRPSFIQCNLIWQLKFFFFSFRTVCCRHLKQAETKIE